MGAASLSRISSVFSNDECLMSPHLLSLLEYSLYVPDLWYLADQLYPGVSGDLCWILQMCRVHSVVVSVTNTYSAFSNIYSWIPYWGSHQLLIWVLRRPLPHAQGPPFLVSLVTIILLGCIPPPMIWYIPWLQVSVILSDEYFWTLYPRFSLSAPSLSTILDINLLLQLHPGFL